MHIRFLSQLDHVLECTVGSGVEDLQQHKPSFWMFNTSETKSQYRELKKVLEVDGEAVDILTRTPSRFILFGLLTLVDASRIPLDLHVRSAPPVSINPHPEIWDSSLHPPTNYFAPLLRFYTHSRLRTAPTCPRVCNSGFPGEQQTGVNALTVPLSSRYP